VRGSSDPAGGRGGGGGGGGGEPGVVDADFVSGVAGGEAISFVAASRPCRRVPHSPQKASSAAAGAPQDGQFIRTPRFPVPVEL
jgi:hypothetical protein